MIALIVCSLPCRADSPFSPNSVDERLRTNVDFWIRIYTQYDTKQGVVHDAKYIDHIYEVIDLTKPGPSPRRRTLLAERKWKRVLLSARKKLRSHKRLTPDEEHVVRLFSDVTEPNKLLNAAGRKRIRFQLGQKDRFLEGYIESGRYLPEMEKIFRDAGLPVELTRIPFVESSFNIHARSKAGASGIWQFIRVTARHYLRVDRAVDERNDPIRATEAAAKFLNLNYAALKSWPLAITAYNHGRAGMARQEARIGTTGLEDVVFSHRSHRFGFASSNYYAEFLAALSVERNATQYFGKVRREQPLHCFEVRIPNPIQLHDLARFMGFKISDVKEYNPAILESVYTGRRHLPAGYRLRLPFSGTYAGLSKEAAARVFMAGYEKIPNLYKNHGITRGKKGIHVPRRNRRRIRFRQNNVL